MAEHDAPAEAQANTADPATDIRLIDSRDAAALDRLAGRLAAPRVAEWYWEDSLRANPVASFLLLFANPANIVMDIGPGDGVFLFREISPGWRAQFHGITWGPKATRRPQLWRRALAVAMTMGNLFELDAVTRDDNRAARIALKSCGFRFTGTIPGGLCYNGEPHAGHVYRLTRDVLGLPPR